MRIQFSDTDTDSGIMAIGPGVSYYIGGLNMLESGLARTFIMLDVDAVVFTLGQGVALSSAEAALQREVDKLIASGEVLVS